MMSHRVVTPGHTRSHRVTTNNSASVYVSASVLSLPGKEIYVVDVPSQPSPRTPNPLKFAPGSILAPKGHTYTPGTPSASPEPTSARRGALR